MPMFCAKFFGRFKDEHADSGNESDEDKTAKKKPAKKATEKKKGGASTIALAPYMAPLRVQVTRDGNTVTQELLRIRAENKKKDFSSDMVEAISELPKVHTIEITKCGVNTLPKRLTEMYDLRIVKISGHALKTVDMRLGQVEYLEELHLDNGLIKAIEPRTFAAERFANLSVLNLKGNQLVFLPQDFAFYTSKLEYLDLSENKLVQLPESLFLGKCKLVLQVLLLDHNNLQTLPESIENAKQLRKLFLSFNNLTSLPSGLGGCVQLEKLRLVQNQLEKLPFSILKIKDNLNEVLVDRNPLKMPSLTSFKMGGLTMAWRLLAEEQENVEKAKKKQKQEEEMAAIGLTFGDDGDQQDSGGGMKNAIKDATAAAADPATAGASSSGSKENAGATTASSKEGGSASASGGGAPGPSGGAAAEPSTSKVTTSPSSTKHHPKAKSNSITDRYYFLGVEDRVAEIRQMENTLLLQKKKAGIDIVQKEAKQRLEDPASKDNLSEEEREHLMFLSTCDVSTYTEKIAVAEVDLYLYLLVYATKPLYSTCPILFDRFDTGDTGYLSEPEFRNFVVKIPITLPDHIEKQMWNIFRQGGNTVKLEVFIAVYHLHELQEKDPQISRITQLMDLDYYDMDVAEMERRLSAKSSGDAAPTLDFNAAAGSGESVAMHKDEGEGGHLKTGKKNDKTDDQLLQNASNQKARQLSDIPVFLDATQYLSKQLAKEDGESDDDLSEVELHSDDLSDGNEDFSSDESFDALDHLSTLEVVNDEDVENNAGSGGGGPVPSAAPKPPVIDDDDEHFQVSSELDLAKMMSMAIEQVLPAKYLTTVEKHRQTNFGAGAASGPSSPTGGGTGGAAGGGKGHGADDAKAAAEKKKKQQNAGGAGGAARKRRKKKRKSQLDADGLTGPMDRRFRTDVLQVRKSLRKVYRNLPQESFERAVNYILKSLRYMKSEKTETATYWHAFDPTFKNSLGSNVYCVQLLEAMGFLRLMNMYWVWPCIHLAACGPTSWGKRSVPSRCSGTHKERLDDMILLFTHLRQDMAKNGVNFDGFFK
ncbi:unnamed protein product [Amoebophrya sp. A120]|nr:unnamed protein product [Amoebophrya sp. A120]|eukprot:GSA120T00004339001.1